jgi:ABC-2 type transport system permease protein
VSAALQRIGRRAAIYKAVAAMMPKFFMAYSIWVWMTLIVQIIAVTIFAAFWTAVYANSTEIAGLSLDQTLNYIFLGQIFSPALYTGVLFEFGSLLRRGEMAIALLRPIDIQGYFYTSSVTQMVFDLILKIPLAIFIWLVFGLRLSSDPVTWLVFLVTLFLGYTVLFCFDYILACAAFYSTEVWGLSVLRFGVANFASGLLVPLDMMPEWLRQIAAVLPFSQALYSPVSILSGITPISEAPRIWLFQLIYLGILLLLSRLLFNRAVRTITVQGG